MARPERCRHFMRASEGNPFAALLTGLVSQWTMNAATGANEPDTISGNTLTLVDTSTSVAGKISTARVLTHGYLAYATGATYNLYPMSFSFWFKVTSVNGVLVWHYNGALNGYTCYLSGGKLAFFIYIGGGNNVDHTFTTVVNDDTWRHCCIVLDASGVTCYLNGVSDGSKVWTGTPQAPTSTSYFSAGVSNMENVRPAGNIDCLKIWSVALTPTLVALDYNAGAGKEL